MQINTSQRMQGTYPATWRPESNNGGLGVKPLVTVMSSRGLPVVKTTTTNPNRKLNLKTDFTAWPRPPGEKIKSIVPKRCDDEVCWITLPRLQNTKIILECTIS
ncbi:jg2285 [Pararge aegeria aegeria]|uniref:Jg2285 protein n=1 Tax=Pararge aegeria aegeria TaxID=348720 RepID=A0A8S4RWI4_9NEOP|nr:jg2285 [Pararge aegeria aegeria]